jgi:hypothetical protein
MLGEVVCLHKDGTPDSRNSSTSGPALTGWSCTVNVSKEELIVGGLKKGSKLATTAITKNAAMKTPGICATVLATTPGFVSLQPYF